MNCYKGICQYREDETHLCERDRIEGKTMEKCDMEKVGQHLHKCRYGYVDCEDCYRYIICDEA